MPSSKEGNPLCLSTVRESFLREVAQVKTLKIGRDMINSAPAIVSVSFGDEESTCDFNVLLLAEVELVQLFSSTTQGEKKIIKTKSNSGRKSRTNLHDKQIKNIEKNLSVSILNLYKNSIKMTTDMPKNGYVLWWELCFSCG